MCVFSLVCTRDMLMKTRRSLRHCRRCVLRSRWQRDPVRPHLRERYGKTIRTLTRSADLQVAVIAIDTSLTRLACARHNAELYGVADHIRFVHADFVQWARDLATKKNVPSIGPSDPWDDVEVVFLSPPWGGVDYMRERAGTALANKSLAKPANVYTLETLAPLPGKELMSLSRQLTPHVALYVPRNTDLKELGELVNDGEKAEVEEERMNGKVKALTVYFGELASLPEA